MVEHADDSQTTQSAPGAAPPPQAAPAQSPPPGQYAAPPPPQRSNRALWIVVIVIVLSLLCFCAVGGGLLTAGFLAEDAVEDAAEGESAEPEAPAEADGTDDGDERVPATLDEVRAEAERMITHFYPDCELQSLSEVAESGEGATYDLVAAYPTTPGFRFVVRSDRSGGDWALYEPDFQAGEYVDEESGALWVHDKIGVGIYALLGSDGLFTDLTAPAMTAAYAGVHPGRLVNDFAAMSQIDVEYGSIAEDELSGWDGVSWTHRSFWTNDIASGTWVQVGEETVE
jgi:hypothetical protein